VVQIVVTSGIFVSTAIPLYSLKPLQAIISAALLTGLIALLVAQETTWAGSATSALVSPSHGP
ncbi:MAG: hypothetical protein ACXVDF_24185, partial [Ktedonobacterales bacterium]